MNLVKSKQYHDKCMHTDGVNPRLSSYMLEHCMRSGIFLFCERGAEVMSAPVCPAPGQYLEFIVYTARCKVVSCSIFSDELL